MKKMAFYKELACALVSTLERFSVGRQTSRCRGARAELMLLTTVTYPFHNGYISHACTKADTLEECPQIKQKLGKHIVYLNNDTQIKNEDCGCRPARGRII